MFPTRLQRATGLKKGHVRHKRDTFPSTSSSEGFGTDKNVLYEFPAYGKKFIFHLTFTGDFISSNVKVEHLDRNFSLVEDGFQGNLSKCFVSGEVNNDSSSRAAFSLCDGMVSTK